MVKLPDDPRLTVMALVGDGVTVKTGVIAVTVMLTDVVAVVPSVPVPVTVTLNVPVWAIGVAVNVRVALPVDPIWLWSKFAETPEGKPDTDRLIFEL